ncbi:hypothetical protein [Parasphingorhabdus sp.]|uniref:hypothetical protein n=1 Tax=Parasphingorhabdus sp. TaxID=2709688 RepID=UPI0030036D5E
MNSGKIDVRALIEKLKDVLSFLDENDLAVPAIKVEEAINALKQIELGDSETTKRD